jgi:uncharacterized membrane protein YccC
MFSKFDRSALFSLNSFAAAMLALYVAFALGLPRPYWAMTTAYIVSQPLSGAVRSKAVYRVLGSLLGGAFAVAVVPSLANAPVLLSLALALWVGGCLTISLLDRTPRSYVLMLAGYTAAIIAFPAVNQPGAIFEIAVSRVVEIGLGILCATLLHSLVFPRAVGDAIVERAVAWMDDAHRWTLDILRQRNAATAASDRRHLAAAASEIQILASHLPFDTSHLRDTTASVRAVHERMLLLIPLLSGVSDRMDALADQEDAEVRAGLDAVAAWVEAGCPVGPEAALTEQLRALSERRAGQDWPSLLIAALAVRVQDVIATLGEARDLLAHVREPYAQTPPRVQAMTAAAGRRRLHADLPLAALSGVAATLAVLISCAIWIVSGWGDGASAPVMAAVFCCFFAAMDDPIPAIANFGLYFLLSMPLSAVYMFAILPAISGFPMLAAVMAPPLLVLGWFVAHPRWSGSALAFLMGFCGALALQETFSADFASFLNVNLGQFVGLFSAIFVTGALRSMSADAGARRLLNQTAHGLAALARARTAPSPAAFAARLVDRLALLTPKLAAKDPAGDAIALRALSELRVGMNLVAVQDLRQAMTGPARLRIDALLAGIGDLFSDNKRRGGDAVLTRLDAVIADAAGDGAASVRDVSALVGLRRNLFPAAPAYAGAAS